MENEINYKLNYLQLKVNEYCLKVDNKFYYTSLDVGRYRFSIIKFYKENGFELTVPVLKPKNSKIRKKPASINQDKIKDLLTVGKLNIKGIYAKESRYIKLKFRFKTKEELQNSVEDILKITDIVEKHFQKKNK